MTSAHGLVASVHRSATHSMGKPEAPEITLVAGLGVDGDAHAGATVQHLSRIKRDPTVANLRQVHLIPAELHDELRGRGFSVAAGEMGENLTTRGIDILGLPTGTTLHLGESAVVELTGLRTPCGQLNGVEEGLQSAVLDRDEEGNLVRRAGVMSIVVNGGAVRAGDPIVVVLPAGDQLPLQPV